MMEGFSVKSTWIPCQTKIMADSKTGKRLIWDTARGEFIPDPKKKTPVNKKTLFTIYAETTTFGVGIPAEPTSLLFGEDAVTVPPHSHIPYPLKKP